MAAPPQPAAPQAILATVQTLQRQQALEAASQLLATHLEQLLVHYPWQTLADVLADFPADLLNQNPDLHYVEGLICARNGKLNEAIKLLERAKFSYRVSQQNFDQAARCCLEIVRIYLSREHFAVAYHYLQHELQPLVQQEGLIAPQVRARFCLRMAEITPDMGKLRGSVAYALQALQLYQAANDQAGQFYALIRLSSASTHLADHHAATSYLELAKTYHTLAGLGALDQARLLNIEIHLHWQRGELKAALALAQRYQALADSEAFSNFRVYARILLGNLYRALGDFAAAEQGYAETRQIAEQLNYILYYPWIDVQTAWLRTLQNRLDEARTLVYSSLKTSDLGQAMSFQVFLAVIELIDGKSTVAQRLLQESYAFYEQSGDELTLCALCFYLAQATLQQRLVAQARHYLENALVWLAQRRLDYFPHWWHPSLLSQICAYGLTLDLYPEVIERIFLNHLQKAGTLALNALLQTDDPVARPRAYALLQIIEGVAYPALAHLPSGKSRQVLEELLQKGLLQRDGFARLQAELLTAQQRHTPNPTIMAVFGLYVHGSSRSQIAEKLECSLANVRNYITLIYHHFGLEPQDFGTRRSRRQRLVEIARERGFVG